MAVIWVASSEGIQFIFGELHYDKPFFLTYLNTPGFALWNLGYCFLPKWKRTPWEDTETPQPVIVHDPRLETVCSDDERDVLSVGEEEVPCEQLWRWYSLKRIWKTAILFCP